MQLISVNVGQEKTIANAKSSGKTGIHKKPVDFPVSIGPLGLDGDAIVDTKHHGGVDQAVYVYGAPDYEWWSAELGRELFPGTFGDNLTISSLESARMNIGDRLQIGSTLLEVTSPRIPCVTLAARMDDPKFVKRFRAAEKPGVYCRVIEPGQVQVGNPVIHTEYPGEKISVVEMFRAAYISELDEATLRRFLAAPIDIRSRREWEEK